MLEGSFGVSVVSAIEGRRLTGPMTLAGLALLACAVTRFSGLDRAGVSFCYFKAFTGYACFTCGTTRALGHLSRFDLPAAFSIQPLATIGTIGLLVWGVLDATLAAFGRRTVMRFQGRAAQWTFAVGLGLATLNWVYLLVTGV